MQALQDEKKGTSGMDNRINEGFLAALSHELRTPLTPVLAAAELLGSPFRLSDAEVKRHVELIRRNVLLEVRLIDNLLDLARLFRGTLLLRIQEVNLHKILAEAARLAVDQASRRDVTFDLRLEAPDPVVQGDAARLSQIFSSLLSNAAKHSNAGDTVTVTTSCPASDSFQVVITDRGLGIAPEQMQNIFEAFRPRDSGLVPRSDGLGLGLAIAKGLVEAHHGKLTAHSEGLGKGATFTIVVPVHQQAPVSPSPAPTAKPPVTDSTPPTCTILLVDDHEDTRNALRSLLEKKGYRVLVAVDLKDARQAAATQSFDLLVSDLNMPDGSGLELMESLKPTGARGIAISGFGTDEDVEKSRRAGFSQHLTKPITFEALDTALQHLLNGKCAKL